MQMRLNWAWLLQLSVLRFITCPAVRTIAPMTVGMVCIAHLDQGHYYYSQMLIILIKFAFFDIISSTIQFKGAVMFRWSIQLFQGCQKYL